MTDVTANFDTEVTTDGAGLGILGVGLAQHNSAGLDDIGALPNHGNDRSGGHVLDQSTEERLGTQIGIMRLQVILAGLFSIEKKPRYSGLVRLETPLPA